MPSPSSELRRARPLLGTLVEIRASGDMAALAAATDAAFAAIERIQRLMSFRDADSDVTRLNRAAFRSPVRVERETWEVLAAAAQFSQASNGVFDITVARQLVDWGYLPELAPIDGASDDRASYRDVLLEDDCRVRFAKPLLIDLGGIAKGYAVDRACEALESYGVRAYVVNAGGDLRVGSAAEPVHVRDPAAPGRLLPLATLADASVATSASYFAAKRWRGRDVQPLVVPATRSAAASTASVSVIADRCMTSDALTKIVALLEDDAASALRSFDAEACILTPAGNFRLVGGAKGDTMEVAWT